MVNMSNNREVTNVLIYQDITFVKSSMSEAKLSFLKNAAIAHYIVAADTSTIHAEPKKKRDYFSKYQPCPISTKSP
ncbi:hypothetical protein GCM10007414_10790 [Agarivorans gilvus]|jgi:hypothetical protein|uniref:Uncharacterized protein n=1 Tax=Agarivorans gilvus TaxID=680279 RepID=A0ABQ1I006_9ALTE|nr:hypothetical protein GCM10007414_10790 [Agarivorans gilvus]